MLRRHILSLLVLACCVVQAHSADVSVDVRKKFQNIDGFGVCGTDERLVKDMNMSIIRTVINPSVLSWRVEKWQDISWKDFKFTGSGVTAQEERLKALSRLYKMNPKEIKVLGTPWTPPAWMKTNNLCAYGGHLRRDRHKHYAKYLAEWIKFLKERYGVPLYAISVQNELFFTEPYGSCVYELGSGQFGEVVKEMGRMFKAEGVAHVKILGPEGMTHATTRIMTYLKEVFDDPETRSYFGIVATHGYKDGIISSGSPKDNMGLAAALKKYPEFPSWMSESSGELPQWEDGIRVRKKGGISKRSAAPGAFGLGRKIHNTIVHGNMSAYIYWLGRNPSYKKDGVESLIHNDVPSKKYYALKHFAKYVRPNSRRVEATSSNEVSVIASAYHHAKNGTLTMVIFNQTQEAVDVPISIQGCTEIKPMGIWQTTAAEGVNFSDVGKLTFADGRTTLKMPAHSIVTLHGKVAAE
jgi:glucuronoarabinoxylan endo-1,4-beta-xylanase